jgi:predicted phage terminase large subunit-like protein
LGPPGSLSFQQGGPTWQRYRQRALTDLYWFADVVLNYGERVPMRKGPHALLCKFAEKRTGIPALDNAPYRKIEMPRETGKTTIITQAYTIQCVCADPNTSILIVNEKEQTARDFLSEIKHQFETNEFLRALFPEVIPDDLNDTTWSASRIVVKRSTNRKEPTVFVIGVGGTVIGLHPDKIICDDIISREAMENARAGSWQIMHQTNRWIHQLDPLLSSNAKPFPEIIFTGTRWFHGDSYEHIEKAYGSDETPQKFLLKTKIENGETQQITAFRVGDIAVFRRAAIEDNRSIFPEKWDLEKLAKLRIRDEGLFSCNYMNSPEEATATFKSEWLHYYDWLDEKTVQFIDGTGAKKVHAIQDLDVLLFVDPGGFAVRQIEDRANAAIIVTGSTPKGEHLILEADSDKDTFLGCIRKILDKVGRYTPRRVYVEVAGQQAAFVELLRREAQNANLPMSLDVVKPGTQHKEVRILTLEPYFQRGQIYLGKSASFTQFHQQFRQFPRAARLDLLDALGYGPQCWRKISSSQLNHAKRQQQELESYYQRRGLSRR